MQVRRSAAIVLLMLIGAMLLPASPASASIVCDDVISDQAHVFGNDQSRVAQAAQKLTNLGAEVRVRTLPNLGNYGTLDGYIQSSQQSCSSWRGIDGHRKNNLVVFAMSKSDRKVGVFEGDSWKLAFDKYGGEQRIWSQYMGPQFRNGDFTGGFVDGINEAYREINEYTHPSSSGSGGGTVVHEKPTDYSGLWIVLGAIVALLALGGLVWFIVASLRRRREANEERDVARQDALSARDATTNLTQALGDPSRQAVREAKVAKYAAVSDEVGSQLRQALDDVNTEYKAATNAMGAAASASATADDKGLSTGEYRAMEGRYKDALAHAQAAKDADDRIDDICGKVEAQLGKVPDDITSAQGRLDQTTAKVESLKNEGVTVDGVDNHLNTATLALDQAKEHQTDLSALEHLNTANQELDEANARLDEVMQQRAQLAQGIPELEARIAAVEGTVATARDTFQRISTSYAQSSWESVQGNGTEAEKRIVAAKQALAKATEQSSQQQWDDAVASMQEGNLLLDKAQSLLRSITELETNLAAAKQQAPEEIRAAHADIDKAAGYIHQFDADIQDGLESDLQAALDQLEQASRLLAGDQPDYLQVVALATEANSAADRIFDEAVTEHEAQERLRRQAASALAQAPAAVSKAKEYIDDHRSDVGSSAEDSLDKAKRQLQQAQNALDPSDVLRHATKASELADSAYQRAKRDVDDAEDQRRRERQRREEERRRYDSDNDLATGILIGSSLGHDHGYGDSDWGGGGGSFGGFGGFGDGGGSFGGFGGGGDGGGSSGSW